jgi:glycosyltransferase involved in cell wall biosynthesis
MPTNVGPYPTRNKAFELTETPYHFYLDGDDQLLPNSVKLVLDTFAAHPDAAFVYGDYELFGATQSVKAFPKIYNHANLVEGVTPPGACAYSKATWEKLRGFAQELARGPADYDFHIGAMEAGFHGVHCGNVFYRYRTGHSSVTGSYDAQTDEIYECIVHRHPKFFANARLRKRFLAIGYRRAAVANHMKGDRPLATRLARKALRLGLCANLQLWRMALRGLMPN